MWRRTHVVFRQREREKVRKGREREKSEIRERNKGFVLSDKIRERERKKMRKI